MNTFNLFPTPVSFFKLPNDLTEEQVRFLKGAEQRPNEGNTTSKFREVLDHELFADLKEFMMESLNTYFDNTISPMNDVKLRVTQSWLNYTKKGQWHHKHAHPNSIVSGVFYVNADKEKDKIFFYKDGYKQLSFPTERYNEYNSESWWLPVGTNELILFPSSLTHSVAPVETNETRISLAFNTFPVGDVGNDETLTGLKL
jgi:uncharacterized protein (TIGR02466 family)